MKLTDKQLNNFWSKVNKTDTCWLWTGYTNVKGYGTFNLNGKPVLAHRLSKMLSGSFPLDNQECDHLCRIRNCVRPSHLEWVDHKENVRRGDVMGQTWAKGKNIGHTRTQGTKHGNSKLDEDSIFEIRRVVDCGITQTAIAKQWGISQGHVSRIVRRESWAHT